MSLSFLRVPEYDLTLSNNVKVKYRPFLIKEEKVLNFWTRELEKIWTFTETGNFISFPKVNAKKPKI